MKFNKILSFFAIIFFLTAFGFSVSAAAQTVGDKPFDLMSLINGNSVEGFWNLNINESDDIVQKIQNLMQKSNDYSDKAVSIEQTEIPAISISILPPERLVLIGGEDEMTINEFYTDIISTRTLITDGQIHFYHTNNTDIAVNTLAKKNKLSIETLSPRGNHMMETFELSADGSKLKVSIQISDSNFQELLTLQRIYDRVISDDFSAYN